MSGSAARTLGVFAALGPPIGMVTLSLISGVISVALNFDVQEFQPVSVLEVVLGLMAGAGIGVAQSYVFGLVPAAVSGGLVAWVRKRRSRYEPLWVGLIGLLVGLAYTSFLFLLMSMILPLPVRYMFTHSAFLLNLSVLTTTCIAATLVCWVIVRRFDEPERIPA